MATVNFTARSSTYEQHFNDLQASIIAADLEYKKQEMMLNDTQLFSKNQIDAALQRVRKDGLIWSMLSFVAGLMLAYFLCRLK